MARDFTKTSAHVAAHLTRLFSQAFQTRFAPHGVSPAQYPILLHLWREDGLTQHQLCDLVGIEQPTMANTLKRMVRDGLVRKIQDDNDRRKVRIRLTRKAVNLEETLNRSADEVLATAWSGFTTTGRDAFYALVRRMISNLEQDLEQDPLLLEQEISPAEPAEPSFPVEPPVEPAVEPVVDETVPEQTVQEPLPEPEPEPDSFGSALRMSGEEESVPQAMAPGSLWPEQDLDQDEDLESEPLSEPLSEAPESGPDTAGPEFGPSPEFPYDPDQTPPSSYKPRVSDDESEMLILEEIYLAPDADPDPAGGPEAAPVPSPSPVPEEAPPDRDADEYPSEFMELTEEFEEEEPAPDAGNVEDDPGRDA